MSIYSDLKGFVGLGADINKQSRQDASETEVGVVSEKVPELTLDMKDEDIVKLTNKWESVWMNSTKRNEWLQKIEENEKYWLGKHHDSLKADKSRPMVDNLIFESLETFLPQATRRNPEPLVEIHSTSQTEEPNPAYDKYKEKLKNRLADLADENKLRLKLKKSARHWAIYHLGVAKFGWDMDKDIPSIRNVRPKKLILDPDAVIDEDGYSGDRVGEYRKMRASLLMDIIENSDGGTKDGKKKIQEVIDKENNGTEIQFIEWWTMEYMCWKLGDTILMKIKNPHWNYDKEVEDNEVDEYGAEIEQTKQVKGINHFPVPKMPYIFLSVFNLGDQPMDKTGLIQQNLSNQDLINKRNKQIDKNADNMNGGAVVSLERSGLSKNQASGVVKAIRKGGAVVIPSGIPSDAISFPQRSSLPNDVYNQLLDTRSRLRDIFGTSGSTPAGVKEEDTVRGKIQIRSLDTDRIGGGISEYLEQFADDAYNWFTQLLYVYDEDFQFIEGAEPPRINVSVKEGSLLPKDSISIANQALELARMQKISNIDLYKRLEYPNPEELAANVWLEQNAPQILYKDNPMVQEALGMIAQQQQQEVQQEVQETAGEQSAQAIANVAEQAGEELVKELPMTPQQ